MASWPGSLPGGSGGGRWKGCHGAGRSLAQRLVADGEAVLDVSAKLAARVRVYSRGHGRKTDKDDAVSVGLAALDGTGVLAVAPRVARFSFAAAQMFGDAGIFNHSTVASDSHRVALPHLSR